MNFDILIIGAGPAGLSASIRLAHLAKENKKELKELIENHYRYTESDVAKEILENWEENAGKFIKVMPAEYKKALQKMEEEKMEQEQKELKTA